MKAWRAVMEEWEQSAKQIKSNAEILESVCQDKLTQLYQDKRKARKAYQEEHNKIAAQFTNVSQQLHVYIYIYASISFFHTIFPPGFEKKKNYSINRAR